MASSSDMNFKKGDPIDEQAYRKKTRKRVMILIVSLVLLMVVIVGVAGTAIRNKNKNNEKEDAGNSSPVSSSKSIKAVCSQTRYPESCYSSISELDTSNTTDPQELMTLSLQVAFNSLKNLSSLPQELMKASEDENGKKALNICQTVINHAVENLQDSISLMHVKSDDKQRKTLRVDDLRIWLSSALTNQDTCLDALKEMNSTLYEDVKSKMQNTNEYTSNSLAIVTKVSGVLGKLNVPIHRKLLAAGESEFPGWVSSGVRKLLQAGRPRPNLVVAKDGSGDVKTINEALARIPMRSNDMFIIYIKEGEYKESVYFTKPLMNVMIYGDGKDKSIVSASQNYVDGNPTFTNPTVIAEGVGFVAMDMGFKNTAGAAKHQAVAFRSSSDCSVFYRCSFDAFQDTLYNHLGRQFFRDCDVIGTVDFIFGDAAVVFQNCNIMPRQPGPNQFVTITAQGRKEASEPTGISIQKCDIRAFDTLTAPVYLGRPWKDCAVTVIMQSTIGGFMRPEGWISWVTGVDPPASIFYGEYQNTGPGANTDQRVRWAGYKPKLTTDEASRYTVGSFIKGPAWLPQKNVMFETSL